MGVDQGLRLIATLPDYEGIVIDAEGTDVLLRRPRSTAVSCPKRAVVGIQPCSVAE